MRAVSLALVLAPALALALAGSTRYPGSMAAFLWFNACFAALVAAMLPRPRLYSYTVLAFLALMGFWAKTMVHTIWAPSFLEPVGAFGNSPAEWDQALFAMSAAALGLLGARAAHLAYRRRRPMAERGAAVPKWFAARRRFVWGATLVAVVAVNAANLQFAFYQIGVNPKWLLPLRLHVLLAWLVNIGFALWIAALLWWDYRAQASTLRRNITIAFAESLVSSISAFSRILYLVHSAPYWLALLERRKQFAAALTRRATVLLAACFTTFFVASVFAVFVLRSNYYPSNADLGRNIKLEIPQLIVQRWVGLEGVLAVGAVPDRGAELLRSAVTESPRLGMDSLYQRTARTRYQADENRAFSFGSNAGPVAVLLFSGSLIVVATGMGILMAVLIATEESAARWTGNPFLAALAGASIANVASQTTFFYLTLIFLLQMWVAIAVLAGLARAGR